jgi:preprotein translocase subunit YajC
MSRIAFESFLAMGAPPPGTQPNPKGQMLQMVATLVFFMAVMYFLMIRPQQKKAREHAELMKSVKPGDKVVCSGGIVGVVVAVKEKTMTVRSADTKLEVLKSAVTEVSERGTAES